MTKCSSDVLLPKRALQATLIIALFLSVLQVPAVHAASLKWNATTEQTYVGPIVSGDTVFTFSAAGKIFAFDRITGSRSWSRDINSSILVQPILSRNTLYIPASNGIYAIGISGQDKGSYITNDSIVTSPIAYENLLIVISYNGTMHVFDITRDISKTTLLRTISLGGRTASSSVAYGGKAYTVLDNGDVLSADPYTGTKVKIAALLRGVPHANPIVTNNTLILGAENYLIAVSISGQAIGSIEWRTEFDSWVNSISYDRGNELLYVGSNDGSLHLVNANNGNAFTKFSAGDAIKHNVATTGHTIYVASNDNKIYAVYRDGNANVSKRWMLSFDDWPTAPQYASGIIYTVTFSGAVYAISTLDCSISTPEKGDDVATAAAMKGSANADAGISAVAVRVIGDSWENADTVNTSASQSAWKTQYYIRGYSGGEVPLQCMVIDSEQNSEILPYTEVVANYVFSPDNLPEIVAKYPDRVDAAKQFAIEFYSSKNTTLKDVEVTYADKTYAPDKDGTVTLTTPPTEGRITIVANAPNYKPLTITIDVGRSAISILIYVALGILGLIALIYLYIRSRAWRR